MAGFDTAGTIQEVESAAMSEFSKTAFWLRYFSPCPYTAVNSSSTNANDECAAAYESGAPYLGPITSPTQSRLSGTEADGTADANTFTNALYTVYVDVGPLVLPTNNELWCWLDQEYSTSLSVDYWNGWSNGVASYNFADTGTYPLLPSLYCDPCAPYPNCSTLLDATYPCYGIWSSEPEPCGDTENPPTWDGDTCSGCGVDNGVNTNMWQYGEQTVCGYSADVDLDLGHPSLVVADYCFYISSNPN